MEALSNLVRELIKFGGVEDITILDCGKRCRISVIGPDSTGFLRGFMIGELAYRKDSNILKVWNPNTNEYEPYQLKTDAEFEEAALALADICYDYSAKP